MEVEESRVAFEETPRPGEVESRELRREQAVASRNSRSKPLAQCAVDDRLGRTAHLHVRETKRIRHLFSAQIQDAGGRDSGSNRAVAGRRMPATSQRIESGEPKPAEDFAAEGHRSEQCPAIDAVPQFCGC